MKAKQKPLWKCPKCGQRFTGKNMWHSCGKFPLKDLFARSEPHVLKTFHKYARMVRACGKVRMIPQKTRVVFQARMRFAGASPRRSHLLCAFMLPRKIDSRRFHKVEKFGPHSYGHYLAVRSEEELSTEVTRWLKQAYAVGQQKHLT